MFYFPTNFDFTLPSAPTNNTPTPPANDAFTQSIQDAMMADAMQNNAPTPSANDAYAQAIRDAMQNNGGSATPTTTGAPVFGPQPNPNAAPTTGTDPYANPDNWDDAAWANVLSGNAEFEQSIQDAMMADAIQDDGGFGTPAPTGAPAFVLPTLESGFYNTLTPAQTNAILEEDPNFFINLVVGEDSPH